MRSMKRIILFSITVVVLAVISINAASDKSAREKEYRKMADLIERGDFTFEARRAYPRSGRTVDLTTNRGFIIISEETAEARLPFFGRAYNIPYGGNGGIRFSNEIENVEISKDPDKMRIRYSFEVRDRENFNVTMDIGYNGNASVNVISNNRSNISYQGYITGSGG
jgi:hypothetical protein